MELFVLYNKYMPKKYTSRDLLIEFSWGIFGALKKWIASADMIHDLYKSSNIIDSWNCIEIRGWFSYLGFNQTTLVT